VQDEGNIHVSFGGKEGVFKAFTQAVAISAKTDTFKAGLASFIPCAVAVPRPCKP
jgi:hypothetical protein